jgi:hypothetical protein
MTKIESEVSKIEFSNVSSELDLSELNFSQALLSNVREIVFDIDLDEKSSSEYYFLNKYSDLK